MANNETSTEELEKQQQMQQQYMMQQRRMMQINQIVGAISQLDPSVVLKTFGQYFQGLTCPNTMVNYQLLTAIYQKLTEAEIEDDMWKDIFNALNTSIAYTNQTRFTSGNMNPMMMNGMGMQMGMMGGMNPMMNNMGMMGMNPMMMNGMGMQMGMMPGMMGGMNQFGMQGNQQNTNGSNDIENIKLFVKQNLQPNMMGMSTVDPLIFLQSLSNFKVELDFSEDKQFGSLVTSAIQYAAYGAMNNPMMLNNIQSVVSSLMYSEQMKLFQKNNKGGNNQQFNPMMNNMGMMGMNPMMMNGMGMQMGMMPGMMGGMNTGFDQNQMGGMNPMMNNMGMMGMNPMMMNGMGMNNMMGGYTMNMPGMGTPVNNGSVW